MWKIVVWWVSGTDSCYVDTEEEASVKCRGSVVGDTRKEYSFKLGKSLVVNLYCGLSWERVWFRTQRINTSGGSSLFQLYNLICLLHGFTKNKYLSCKKLNLIMLVLFHCDSIIYLFSNPSLYLLQRLTWRLSSFNYSNLVPNAVLRQHTSEFSVQTSHNGPSLHVCEQ